MNGLIQASYIISKYWCKKNKQTSPCRIDHCVIWWEVGRAINLQSVFNQVRSWPLSRPHRDWLSSHLSMWSSSWWAACHKSLPPGPWSGVQDWHTHNQSHPVKKIYIFKLHCKYVCACAHVCERERWKERAFPLCEPAMLFTLMKKRSSEGTMSTSGLRGIWP